MKRPEGFDEPPAEPATRSPRLPRVRAQKAETPAAPKTAPPVAPTAAPKAAPETTAKGAPKVAPTSTRTAPTMPARVGTSASGSRPTRPTSDRVAPEPRPSEPHPANSATADSPTADSPVRGSRRTRLSSAVGDARRALRKASRERKRYEQSEVRKFTRRSRRRRAVWTTAIALVAVMGIVLAVAVYSPLLALRHIEITGTDTMAKSDVNKAVDDQLGTPLALLDFGKIKSDLAQFPIIRSYVTETVPPDTLIIHVVERDPIGVIVRGTTYDEIDPAGVVLLSTTTKPKFPIIAATGGTKSAAFRSAVNVLLAMPASVLTKVTTITATTPDDVRLKLTGNTTDVVWGSSRDSELKAKGLTAMLKLAKCKSQAEINVSAPHNLVCGPTRG